MGVGVEILRSKIQPPASCRSNTENVLSQGWRQVATPTTRRVPPEGREQGQHPCKTSGRTPRKCILHLRVRITISATRCNRKYDNLPSNCLLLLGKPPNPPKRQTSCEAAFTHFQTEELYPAKNMYL